MEKVKVGIVNYLNTRPLIYGLEKEPFKSSIELIGAYPAKVAEMLKDGRVDVGLVPVAIIPSLPEYHLVGNYCIGTNGDAVTVCLFSEVPLEAIETVYLDYQSRSSVALLRWLMSDYWDIHPEIVEATDESYRERIQGTTAGLVIGDRAFEQRKKSTFFYDLSTEWKKITGLPFVFAAWISTRELDSAFIEKFDAANALGLSHLDEIVANAPKGLYDLKKYYSLHLNYELDGPKKKGMELFLEKLEVSV